MAKTVQIVMHDSPDANSAEEILWKSGRFHLVYRWKGANGSHAQESTEWPGVCTICVKEKRGCAGVSAADAFDIQSVADGFHPKWPCLCAAWS